MKADLVILFVLGLAGGCALSPSKPAPEPAKPTPAPALVYLGEVEGDGYSWHHFRRPDGPEYLEAHGRTMDIPSTNVKIQ